MKYRLDPSSGERSHLIRPGSTLGGTSPVTRPPAPPSPGSGLSGPVASAPGGGTVLGAVIPVAYGYNKLIGKLAFVCRNIEKLYLGWVYAAGEVNTPSASKILFNGEETINGAIAGFVFDGTSVGSITQSVNPWILSELSSDYHFSYPGYAMIFAKCVNTRNADAASLGLEVITNGRKIVDFRTPASASGHNTNPVSVAFDILTSKWPWPGMLSDITDSSNPDIDYDNFAEWANWCDNTSITRYDYITDAPLPPVAIGQKRWEFNGIVTKRNAWDAADAVLSPAFLKLVYVDGKVRIRAEADVIPSDIYIPKGKFIGVPAINHVDPNSIATDIEVTYTSKIDFSQCKINYMRSSAAGKCVELTSMIYGCNSQKQAIRWAEQKVKILKECWIVKMTLGPEVANRAPGDIIKAFLPYGFGDSFVRIMSIQTKPELGRYEISGRIVPESIESVIIENEYTGKNTGGGWSTGTPYAVHNFYIGVHSRRTSRDTYAPIIRASWSAPLEGPRPRYYELKQNTAIIARVFGVKWSGPILSGGNNELFTVNAIGYDGSEGPTTGLHMNVDLGSVSGIGGIPINSGPGTGDDGGSYVFDEGVSEHVLMKMPANFEIHTITILSGNTSATGQLNDITNFTQSVSATPSTPLTTSFEYWATYAGAGFRIDISASQTYDITFELIVGVRPQSSVGTPGGSGLTPGNEHETGS